MLMDHEDMFNAERLLELAEIMTWEVPIEAAEATLATEAEAIASVVNEPEIIPEILEAAPPEPRTARVLSITLLRQKLGIEDTAPTQRTPAPSMDRPRIVRRRIEEPELLAG